LKITTIIGARPQFIKAGVVSREIKKHEDITEIIIHTGQHYDYNMSDIFFKELEIPFPDYSLNVGSGSHGVQTAKMLAKIEEVLIKEKPDWVLVYGDTNSTLAGSLAAVKLHQKVAHVEAGLRSFNRLMPEEINRILTDRISDVLFAPTQNAVAELSKEGLSENTLFVGDVMYDSVLFYQKKIKQNFSAYKIPNIPQDYYLATIHRAENTDFPNRLQSILDAFGELDKPVILPLHPRTKNIIMNFKVPKNAVIIEPVSYLQMLALVINSAKVLTDSGGLQKEAYFLNKYCVTMRDETEWIETLENDWNIIVGADKDKIINATMKKNSNSDRIDAFGNGNSAGKIIKFLTERYR